MSLTDIVKEVPPPPKPLQILKVVHPVTKAMIEFKVAADLDFKNVTDEEWRQFEFPGGHRVRVEFPAFICVKAPPPGTHGGGSLRIITLSGLVEYIPYGWIRLTWKPRQGQPTITF